MTPGLTDLVIPYLADRNRTTLDDYRTALPAM